MNNNENTEQAWDEVFHELIAKGEVSEEVLRDSESIIKWWRSLNSAKQDEISHRVQELARSNDVIASNPEEGLQLKDDTKVNQEVISYIESQPKGEQKTENEQNEKTRKRIRIGCIALVTIIIAGILIGILTPDSTTSDSITTDLEYTFDETSYLNTLQEHTYTLSNAMASLSELLSDYQFGDEKWAIDVATQLVIIQMLYDEIIDVNPPNSMVHIHNKYLQAMAHYVKITQLIPKAIDNLDADLIYEATEETIIGTQYLDESKNLLLEFIAEHRE
jgi:hypothetical protein